jgi:hypothetical protein
MLKRLAILAMFGAFLFGRPSVSHEQNAPTDHKDAKAQSTANPVPPMHAVIEPSTAISQLKPVPDKDQSQPPEKPLPRFARPEWVIVYITAVYVVIAGWTLFAIKRQVRIMDSQAKDAKESSAQTFQILKEQADTALIQAKAATVTARATDESAQAAVAQIRAVKERERARLGIRILDVPEVSGPERILDGMCPLRVCAFVENFGHSKAFNVRAFGILDIVSDPESCPREKGFLHYFPQIINEGSRQHPLKLGGFGREFEDVASSGDAMAVPKETILKIRDGKAFIQASGKLAYEDIFGDSHTVPFRFVWKSLGDDDGGKWLTRSFWMDCNPPSDEQDDSEPEYGVT